MEQAIKTPDRIKNGPGAIVLMDTIEREYVFYVNTKRRCVHGILRLNKKNPLCEVEFHHTEWCSIVDTFDPEVGIWGAKFRLDCKAGLIRWRDHKPMKYQSFKRYMDKFRINETSVAIKSTIDPEHMTVSFPEDIVIERVEVSIPGTLEAK